ncbi:MAG: hypothetical protein ACLTGQ_09230 [Mediterraneibacter gnavus]
MKNIFWHTSVENEAKNCLSKRSMYFKDKSIKEKFKRLSPEYQEGVKKVIFTLSKGNDFLGKNLKNIIDAFGNIAPKVQYDFICDSKCHCFRR